MKCSSIEVPWSSIEVSRSSIEVVFNWSGELKCWGLQLKWRGLHSRQTRDSSRRLKCTSIACSPFIPPKYQSQFHSYQDRLKRVRIWLTNNPYIQLITDTMCLDHIVTPIGGNLKLGVRVGCLLDGYRVCSLRLWLLMYQVEWASPVDLCTTTAMKVVGPEPLVSTPSFSFGSWNPKGFGGLRWRGYGAHYEPVSLTRQWPPWLSPRSSPSP